MARSPPIPPSPHPSRPCWTVMVASSHVWVHTLHWAMLFNYLSWSPRRKYIAHISEAECLGQTHREIKYTLCHLIWQLSFPGYWIEVVTRAPLLLHGRVLCMLMCALKCGRVYESGRSRCGLALNPYAISLWHYSPQRGKTTQFISPHRRLRVWGNHWV